MAVKDDLSEQDELLDKRKLFQALAYDELIRATYSESDDIDGERIAALAKIVCDDEIIPEEYKKSAFAERFNYLHGIAPLDKQKKREQNKQERKQVFYKRTKVIKAASVLLIIALFFTTMNVVTYASANKSFFTLIAEKVDYLVFRMDADAELESDYQLEVTASIGVELSIPEFLSMTTGEVYLPTKLPDYLTGSEVKCSDLSDAHGATITYYSEDYSQLLFITFRNHTNCKGTLSLGYPEDSIRETRKIQFGDTTELLYIYEAEEGLSFACIKFGKVIYGFRYTIETEHLIQIIESMEVIF